jgi:tetratricopeptide (TPR) repeat protein
MPGTPAARAVVLLIDEAINARRERNYRRALAAASRSVLAAEELKEFELLVRALGEEAAALRQLGDYSAAMVRSARVLTMAEDEKLADSLRSESSAKAIYKSYLGFVNAARHRNKADFEKLLVVLDAAANWLAATGHQNWRSSILTERAEVLMCMGKGEEAIGIAQQALAAYFPGGLGYSWAYHHNCLGCAFKGAGRLDDAMSHFKTVVDAPRSSSYDCCQSFRNLARCEKDRGQLPAARRHADSAVRLAESLGSISLMQALASRADIYSYEESAQRALDDLGTALGLDPDYVWALELRGYVNGLLDHHEDVVTDLTRVIELTQDNGWALGYRGHALRRMGRSADALVDLSRSLELKPNDAWALAERGATLHSLSRRDEALADLCRSIELNPEYDWTYCWRGDALRCLKRYEEALADLSRALELNPENEVAFVARGSAYRMLGRRAEALSDLTRSLELKPDYAWPLQERALALRELKRYDEALADFSSSLELERADAWTLCQRGETFRLMGHYEEAVTDLSRALELAPEDASAMARRGSGYRLLGRYEEAVADLSRALELSPDYPWARLERQEAIRAMDACPPADR